MDTNFVLLSKSGVFHLAFERLYRCVSKIYRPNAAVSFWRSEVAFHRDVPAYCDCPIFCVDTRNHLIDDSVSLIEEAGGQLYDSLNNKTGYFVRALGENAGNIEMSNGAILNVFPVVLGKTYTVEASSYTDGFFAIALKTDNHLTGPTLGLVTLSGSGNSRSFTVPAGSTAKFAFMNVYLPLQNWDIRLGLQIGGPIQKVKGIKACGIYD